jgi:hypothetical protein
MIASLTIDHIILLELIQTDGALFLIEGLSHRLEVIKEWLLNLGNLRLLFFLLLILERLFDASACLVVLIIIVPVAIP